MTDVHTREQRSYNMSRIRGKWTKQEQQLHNFLKGHKISHKMHPTLFGNPDILISEKKLVIFLDGCFWHGCPKHFKAPQSNQKFWSDKIKRNRKNDRKNIALLKKMGFRVLRIWECDLKNNSEKVLLKVEQ